MNKEQSAWQHQKELGSVYGIRLLRLLLNYKATQYLVHVLLYPIVFYYIVFAKQARLASVDYWQRVDPKNKHRPIHLYLLVYQHFLTFAQRLVQRFLIHTNDISNIQFKYQSNTQETLACIQQRSRGVVILSAHIGCLEALRALAKQHAVSIKPLMYLSNAKKYNQHASHTQEQESVITIESIHLNTIFMLENYINQPQSLAILADRISAQSQDRYVCVDFLGAPAKFPTGPYILASLLDCPLYMVFCVPIKAQKNAYELELFPLATTQEVKKAKHQKNFTPLVQLYADALTLQIKKNPHQWFNFYPFWQA